MPKIRGVPNLDTLDKLNQVIQNITAKYGKLGGRRIVYTEGDTEYVFKMDQLTQRVLAFSSNHQADKEEVYRSLNELEAKDAELNHPDSIASNRFKAFKKVITKLTSRLGRLIYKRDRLIAETKQSIRDLIFQEINRTAHLKTENEIQEYIQKLDEFCIGAEFEEIRNTLQTQLVQVQAHGVKRLSDREDYRSNEPSVSRYESRLNAIKEKTAQASSQDPHFLLSNDPVEAPLEAELNIEATEFPGEWYLHFFNNLEEIRRALFSSEKMTDNNKEMLRKINYTLATMLHPIEKLSQNTINQANWLAPQLRHFIDHHSRSIKQELLTKMNSQLTELEAKSNPEATHEELNPVLFEIMTIFCEIATSQMSSTATIVGLQLQLPPPSEDEGVLAYDAFVKKNYCFNLPVDPRLISKITETICKDLENILTRENLPYTQATLDAFKRNIANVEYHLPSVNQEIESLKALLKNKN